MAISKGTSGTWTTASSLFSELAPAPDPVVFYLVTGVEGGVETTLGADSAGAERINCASCEAGF